MNKLVLGKKMGSSSEGNGEGAQWGCKEVFTKR